MIIQEKRKNKMVLTIDISNTLLVYDIKYIWQKYIQSPLKIEKDFMVTY
jgi:hypothetical protein